MLDSPKFITQHDPHGLTESAASTAQQELGHKFSWHTKTITTNNPAKQLAHELTGRAVVIIHPTQLKQEAKNWQRYIQYYAQSLCYQQCLEPLDQLYLSWTNQPINKQFAIILLQKEDMSPQDYESFELLKNKLSGKWPLPNTVLAPQGSHPNYLNHLGKVVAYYLGMLNNSSLDPTKKLKTVQPAESNQ